MVRTYEADPLINEVAEEIRSGRLWMINTSVDGGGRVQTFRVRGPRWPHRVWHLADRCPHCFVEQIAALVLEPQLLEQTLRQYRAETGRGQPLELQLQRPRADFSSPWRVDLVRLNPALNPVIFPEPCDLHNATPRTTTATADSFGLADGWNGFAWGAQLAAFRERFPRAQVTDAGWWWTGLGPERFCGVPTEYTQYGFNDRGEFGTVVFIPSKRNRKRVIPAALQSFGLPNGEEANWRFGAVQVAVVAESLAIMINHLEYTDD